MFITWFISLVNQKANEPNPKNDQKKAQLTLTHQIKMNL